MQKITTTAELREAIVKLEYEKKEKGKEVKERFHLLIESLKPLNVIKSTFMDVKSSPVLMDHLLGSTLGYATGYLSRRLVVGASGGIIKKAMGTVLQYGISKIVANNSGIIRSVSQRIGGLFRRKKRRM